MIDPMRMGPEDGFAGREAGPGLLVHAKKEGARGGTMGSPTLNRLHELLAERA